MGLGRTAVGAIARGGQHDLNPRIPDIAGSGLPDPRQSPFRNRAAATVPLGGVASFVYTWRACRADRFATSRKTPTITRLAGSTRWWMTGEGNHLTTTLLRPERVKGIPTNSGPLFERRPVLGSGPRWSRPREQRRALKARPGPKPTGDQRRGASGVIETRWPDQIVVGFRGGAPSSPSRRKSARHPIGAGSSIFRAAARASPVVIVAKCRQVVGSSRHRLLKAPDRHRRSPASAGFQPTNDAPFRSLHPDAARWRWWCFFPSNPAHSKRERGDDATTASPHPIAGPATRRQPRATRDPLSRGLGSSALLHDFSRHLDSLQGRIQRPSTIAG